MNHLSQLYQYIKTIAEEDSNVNHVIKGTVGEVDLDKMIIPPVVNININSGSFTNGNTVNFNVELVCLAQRDINKEVRTDDFWEQDNEIDNLNETHAILNRMWLKMYRDFEKNNITASENPTLTAIIFGTAKLLDGWLLTFEVEMPNDMISLCP
jgi:hypothetical protein